MKITFLTSVVLSCFLIVSCSKGDKGGSLNLEGTWTLADIENGIGGTYTPIIDGIALPSTCDIELSNSNYTMNVSDKNGKIETFGTYDLKYTVDASEDIVKFEESYNYIVDTDYTATEDSLFTDESIVQVKLTGAIEKYAVETIDLKIIELGVSDLKLHHKKVDLVQYEDPNFGTVEYGVDYISVWRRVE